MTRKDTLKPGDLVAFNLLPDATWFEVLSIDRFNLTIREAGTDYSPQHIDSSLIKQRKAQ